MRRLLDELQKEIPNVCNSILAALGKLQRPAGIEATGEKRPALRVF
jgi:hypothetical protein